MTQNYGATADGPGTGPDPNDAALATGQIITGDVPGDGSTFTGTRNVSATDNIPPQTGRFYCAPGTVGGCAISIDEDGKIVGFVGYGWQPIASGMTPVPDADYLAWGVWLSVPDFFAGATNPAAAGAFASGSDVFEVRTELTGTATYDGVATGMYSAGGMVEYFDADVSLTANFGGTAGADSTPATGTLGDNDGLLLGVVTGSVSRIRAGGVSVAGSLTLGRAPVVADAPDDNTTPPHHDRLQGRQPGRRGRRLVERHVGRPVLRPQRCGGGFRRCSDRIPHDRRGHLRRRRSG